MGSAFKRGEKVIVPAIIQVRDDGSVAALPTSPSTALSEKPSGARAFKPGDKVIADSLFQVKDDGSTDQDSAGLVNPMTGLGDIIIGGIAGALRRLAPTTVGQVLTLVAPGVPAWAAGGGGGGGGTTNIDYARIIRSAAFTLVGDLAFHTFPFDTVVEDGNGLWSAVDTGFKIKTIGTYVITWQAPYQGGAGMRNVSGLAVNGVLKAKFDMSANYATWGSVTLRLAANDIVTLQYLCNANNAIITGQDPQVNFLSIVRVGNDVGGTSTAYNFNASASFAVTDAAAFYDLADLTLAAIPAGTYLVTLAFDGSNKSGEVRTQLTDAANVALWPLNATGATNSRHNGDNFIEYSHSFIVVLAAVTTVKVRAAAVGAIGNFTLYDRHLTMIKIA